MFTSKVAPLVGLHNWARLWALLHKLFWFHEVLGCASTPGGDVDWTPCSVETKAGLPVRRGHWLHSALLLGKVPVWSILSGGASICIMKSGCLETVKMLYGWMELLSELSHQMGLLSLLCNWVGSLAGVAV